MRSGKLGGKCCRGRGSSLGLRGCGVARAICGDSDLEKIGTRPCLAISDSAQIQAQKMKRAKYEYITFFINVQSRPE